VVRKELAHYYSSVRRADDCFAATLMALKESGEEDKTFILFLSDHGMPLPFAKTQLYHHSTRTPLMVKWPGVTKGGTVDKTHMVSAVDFLPTLLDVAGIKHPKGLDGRSFAGLIRGGQQKNRDYIIKEYNENAGASRDPMRAVQTKKFLYLFNPWSNGERVMATATSGTSTYRRMKELAATDSRIADRHSLYQHRVVEELFDVENDPDCLVNLIGSPQHQAELARLRGTLMTWMETTGDHMLPVYQKRNDPAVREAYILAREKESAERRTAKGKGNDNPKKKGKATSKKRANLIQLELPKSIQAGKSITVSIPHELPKRLGEQQIHVTLKVGTALKRLDRKVVKVSGKGKVEVTFELPATIPDGTIGFAAFVGAEYTENLQHVATKAIKVE